MRLLALIVATALFTCPAWLAAADSSATPGNTVRHGIWWKWDMSRDWGTQQRRARGTIRTFADPEAKTPLSVETLWFSLEIDCPASGRPEKSTLEGKFVSQLDVEVDCASPATQDFEVRWEFQAEDRRTGPVSDRGVWR